MLEASKKGLSKVEKKDDAAERAAGAALAVEAAGGSEVAETPPASQPPIEGEIQF